jgi:hypothetical protein
MSDSDACDRNRWYLDNESAGLLKVWLSAGRFSPDEILNCVGALLVDPFDGTMEISPLVRQAWSSDFYLMFLLHPRLPQIRLFDIWPSQQDM